MLWQKLRDRALCGLKFRREHQIDCWIVDFYCPELRLIVEVDGGIHDDPDQKVYDEQRSAQLSEKGLTILRFTNEEVIRDISRVMLRLENHVEYRSWPGNAGVNLFARASGKQLVSPLTRPSAALSPRVERAGRGTKTS